MTGRRKRHNSYCIKDRFGKILTKTSDIKEKWIEYSKELFSANRKDLLKTFNTKGLFITKDEIKNTINWLKQNKTPGSDNIQRDVKKPLMIKLLKNSEKCLILYMVRDASLKSYGIQFSLTSLKEPK